MKQKRQSQISNRGSQISDPDTRNSKPETRSDLRALSASAVNPPALSPEKAGILRIINASEEFGIAITELAARVAGAGVHLSEPATRVAAAALCDLGEVVMAGEPPRYFGRKFRPQI